MEFIGQIIKVCEVRKGTSQRTGNEWATQGFVVEFKEHDTDPWHDKVYLETFDTKVMEQLVVGAIVKVGFRHNTREYEGRVYNEVRMNNFELQGAPMESKQSPQTANQPTGRDNTPAVGQSPTTEQKPAQEGAEEDDLPF